jgi:hypothetical protein
VEEECIHVMARELISRVMFGVVQFLSKKNMQISLGFVKSKMCLWQGLEALAGDLHLGDG